MRMVAVGLGVVAAIALVASLNNFYVAHMFWSSDALGPSLQSLIRGSTYLALSAGSTGLALLLHAVALRRSSAK